MHNPIRRTVFALRHKPTGRCMPAWRRGFSWWEPTLDTENSGWLLPRLFPTRRSVGNALTAYLQGTWGQQVQTEGDWEHGYHDYLGTPAPDGKGQVPRVRSDFEIVELTLQEV